MQNELIHTVLRYGNRFLEGYKRITRASDEELQTIGIDTTEESAAFVNAKAISEYVVFQTGNIARSQSKTFSIGRWGDDLDFVSIYIDSSIEDSFVLEITDINKNVFIRQEYGKSMLPLSLPPNPISKDLYIKVTAITPISFIRLVAIPCKILEYISAEEDYTEAAQQLQRNL